MSIQDIVKIVQEAGYSHEVIHERTDKNNPGEIVAVHVTFESKHANDSGYKGLVVVYRVDETFNVGVSLAEHDAQIMHSGDFEKAKILLAEYAACFKGNSGELEALAEKLRCKAECEEQRQARLDERELVESEKFYEEADAYNGLNYSGDPDKYNKDIYQ